MLEQHHAGILKAAEEYWDWIARKATLRFDKKLAMMERRHAAELGETINVVKAINTETLKLQDRTVTIRTVHVEKYKTMNAPARQHGGSVGAGRPYLVGERGPELFVPSRSGRIEPNGSSGGGPSIEFNPNITG